VVVLSQGRIEQVGTPAEIYGEPRTRFVAQFVGTMNRFEGNIAAGRRGFVEMDGALLPASVAERWPAGEKVLLLIRPEAIELKELPDGATLAEGPIEGKVVARTFLGPVTRLTVDAAVGELIVDVGSARALALADGARVGLTWEPASPRIIGLSDTGIGPSGSTPSQNGGAGEGEISGLTTPA
jgi:ABC-type Fe3+/spermidine/putrescine transport system ATPase subunit